MIEVTSVGAEINSPNYPKEYPSNQHIGYHIKIPDDQKFYLEFLAFELQDPWVDPWNEWSTKCK